MMALMQTRKSSAVIPNISKRRKLIIIYKKMISCSFLSTKMHAAFAKWCISCNYIFLMQDILRTFIIYVIAA